MLKLFNNTDGLYVLGAFFIQLDENIDFQDFEKHSAEVKGTFIHEYCHFLQDVSTTYGYSNFLMYMQKFFCKIGKDIDKERLLRNKDLQNIYCGDTEIEDAMCIIRQIEIMPSEKYDMINEGINGDCVIVTYNANKTFRFGSACIAESMAYIVEKRLYDIRERQAEFPYTVCQDICEHEYKEFAQNEIGVLSLCELSLLELNSGVFFMKALWLMREEHFIPSSIKNLEAFIDQHFKIGFRGDKAVIESYLTEMYPNCEIDFSPIRKWLVERFKIGCEFREISKCFISRSLENKDSRYAFWNVFIEKFGCPVLIDKDANRIEGAYLDGMEIDLGYTLAPMAINELLDFRGLYIKKACPMEAVCKNAGDPCYSDMCGCDPRKIANVDELCAVKMFWKLYGLEQEQTGSEI